MLVRAPLIVFAAVLAGGCGAGGDRDEARATVERFYAAVQEDDGEAACAELGRPLLEQVESQTQQSCAGAITRFEYSGGSITRAEVYVKNAKVDLEGGESAFLSRDPEGWRLSAIACRAEQGKPADRPLDCEAES